MTISLVPRARSDGVWGVFAEEGICLLARRGSDWVIFEEFVGGSFFLRGVGWRVLDGELILAVSLVEDMRC